MLHIWGCPDANKIFSWAEHNFFGCTTINPNLWSRWFLIFAIVAYKYKASKTDQKIKTIT